ncbi:MAG: LD-carboxypeptidase [Pseudomonadota bacterium]
MDRIKNKVQIIAPSSGCENAEEMIKLAAEMLEEAGFVVKPAMGIWAPGFAYYANSLDFRLASLREAILDPEVDIIWCFRGGYGAGEIASKCLDIKPSHSKILIGYSDITMLHGLFNWHYHMPSLHASVLTSLLPGKAQHHHLEDIINVLAGQKTTLSLSPLTPASYNVSIDSTLAGGNLTVLTTMIGTKLHPKVNGKILILEDVGEKGYKISRYLNHLSEAGMVDEAAAIILCDFTNAGDNLDYAIKNFCSLHQNIPIFRAEGVGHGSQNVPLVFGGVATIEDQNLRIDSTFTLPI